MIDKNAIVHPNAEIEEGVSIGAFSVVEQGVKIGSNTKIESHVIIRENTTIGADNHIYQFCSIGEGPQYVGLEGDPTSLVIGDRNVVREYCTLNSGTPVGGGVTQIGSDNFLMAYVHIGHDSILGNNTILVNNTALAGHVRIGDWAILSGYTLVHQFCKIGAHSFSGMGTAIGKDVPAYVTVSGSPAEAKTINIEGLRRRGFSAEAISQLRRAFKILYRQGLTLELALQRLETMLRETPEIQVLIDSVRSSERGIVR